MAIHKLYNRCRALPGQELLLESYWDFVIMLTCICRKAVRESVKTGRAIHMMVRALYLYCSAICPAVCYMQRSGENYYVEPISRREAPMEIRERRMPLYRAVSGAEC